MANVYRETGFRRRCHKWAMCGYKGGRCIRCDLRVTDGNLERFHFDHKVQINNTSDKSDRWSGPIAYMAPFTDRWLAWAETVDLICVDCHRARHKPDLSQLALDLAVQVRLDGHVSHAGSLHQMSLFEASP